MYCCCTGLVDTGVLIGVRSILDKRYGALERYGGKMIWRARKIWRGRKIWRARKIFGVKIFFQRDSYLFLCTKSGCDIRHRLVCRTADKSPPLKSKSFSEFSYRQPVRFIAK